MNISLSIMPLTAVILLAACAASGEPTPPDCRSESIAIIPTAARQPDPDLSSPPVLPEGGDGAAYCPTPIPDGTPTAAFPEQFVAAEVVNLSLDAASQELAVAAVGDDMLVRPG